MKKLLTNATANGAGTRHRITDGRNWAVAIADAAVFDGCTITLNVYDRETNALVYTDPTLYQFTDKFDAFEIALAPGMDIEAVISSAGVSTSIPFLHLYKYED